MHMIYQNKSAYFAFVQASANKLTYLRLDCAPETDISPADDECRTAADAF